MTTNGTNSVQLFIRGFVWLVSFIILGIVMSAFGPLFSRFWIVFLIFNAWVSSIISRIFYVLPEWKSMVLLRLGKFDSVKGAGFFMDVPITPSVILPPGTNQLRKNVQSAGLSS